MFRGGEGGTWYVTLDTITMLATGWRGLCISTYCDGFTQSNFETDHRSR